MNKFLERLERDNNFYRLEHHRLIKELTKVEQENEYLKKRNKVLEMVEKYLPQRIEKLKNEYAIHELQLLSDALEYEKNKLKEIKDEQD